jgi:hypothetical protein
VGGHDRHGSARRLRAALAAALAATLAISIAACGGSSSDANEAAGTYRLKVAKASFATRQQLGHTYLLKLGVRNTSGKAVPALTVSISVGGKEGEASTLPFGIRDPQHGLAQPDRPVWVLAEHYPKLTDSAKPGGAETSNQKTFDFGPLPPGAATEAVWKLSAVKAGHYTLLYTVEAGLSGTAKAKTGGGATPGGSFAVDVSSARHDAEVTDSGEVIER